MKPVVVVNPPRADPRDVDALEELGVATVHEAIGRRGLLGSHLHPLWQGARAAGTAVTVLCWPGDNLMVHVAVEQARPGDVLVAATNSPCTDALVGELLATALQARGVRGVVVDAGVRDAAMLRSMGFPVWSRAVSAQGTVKASAGSVNTPVSIGGTLVRPGDVIVADDDGVVCVPRDQAAAAVTAGRLRFEREQAARAAFAAGELSLDRYGLRPQLETLGVTYVNAQDQE
ncbi:MAG TPA: 4-carboxy-4-hydroxy-2-oxoadipate aldolase/oxaloacetate decarboxylase [Actinomycetes bacterium]|nr:4-carboxy-4-hydroxy-2-oxoadipate aldolase/oxaloacetate decarboxylase [Actinomycetes bacterium]